MTFEPSINTVRLYIDGVEAVSNTVFTGSIIDSTARFNIGRRDSSGGDQYFNGFIDEVAVWSKALNASEVLEVFNDAQLPP